MKHFPRRYSRPGTSPGSLVNHRDRTDETPVTIRLIQYNAQEVVDKAVTDLAEYPQLKREGYTSWLHIQGSPDAALLEQLGRQYHLHPLALEDVLHAGQRIKLDVYDNHYFIVASYLCRNAEHILTSEQISIFLTDGAVITIHEGPSDVCEPIRSRLQTKKNLRNSGADYLVYSLLDLIVDSGFPLLEDMGDRLEQVEEEALERPTTATLDRIHTTRRELAFMRRVLWPQRDAINSLIRDGEERISEATKFYFRDVYDHTIQILELIESYRESAASLLDVYLSSTNNRMNEVMKVLTMISTIFLPLSFVVGLYGMNFSTEASGWNMPELHWRYGYFYALLVMFIIAIGMVIVFKRKRWF